jgi:hypothetical protein
MGYQRRERIKGAPGPGDSGRQKAPVNSIRSLIGALNPHLCSQLQPTIDHRVPSRWFSYQLSLLFLSTVHLNWINIFDF